MKHENIYLPYGAVITESETDAVLRLGVLPFRSAEGAKAFHEIAMEIYEILKQD